MNFLQKHIGCIVTLIVALAFIAPRLLTLPGFDWLDLTQTGEIGDTIGGTTAPFWGFLSTILLYLTLKEQQNFNKTQQMASDYDILMKLRDNISELSNNLTVAICHPTGSQRTQYQGSFHIEDLKNTFHPQNAIEEDDFNELYRNCTEIAGLILLFFNMLIQSRLGNDIKRTLFYSVSIHSERIYSLFDMTQHERITIVKNLNSIDDNIFGRYNSTNEKYLNLFSEAYHKLTEMIN